MITTPEDQGQFRRLLGDGGQFGLRLEYVSQARPEGIAQAFVLGADFLGTEAVALILGDNIFHGVGLGRQLAAAGDPVGGRIFAYPVADPQAYGVVRLRRRRPGVVDRGEASTAQVPVRGAGVVLLRQPGGGDRPGAGAERPGELEITAVNEAYRQAGELSVTVLDRGTAWLDTGTFTSLVQAAEFVRVIEERQGMKIGCVEEVAWRAGLIDDDQLRALAEPLTRSGYGDYLLDLLATGRDGSTASLVGSVVGPRKEAR